MFGGQRLRGVSRNWLKTQGRIKTRRLGFDNTYWRSAISSRVSVSKREWMSVLERTVSGMLATESGQFGSRANALRCHA